MVLSLGAFLLLGAAYCPLVYAVPFSFEAAGTGGASSGDEDTFVSVFTGGGSGTSSPFGPFLFNTSGSVNVDTTAQTFVTGGNAKLDLIFPSGDSFTASGAIPQFFLPDTSSSVRVSVDPMTVKSGTGAFSGTSGQLSASFQGDPVGAFTLRGSGDLSVSSTAFQTGLLSPIRALQTIDDARTLLTSQRGTDTAKLANAAYPGVSNLPAGYTVLTALTINNTNGLGIKFIRGPDGNVTVSFRGTELPTNPSTSLQNWRADFGFLHINPVHSEKLSQYLKESTQLVATLEGMIKDGVLKREGIEPGAKITFTGHSLGGALALILGKVTGFDATAFNSLGVDKVLNLYGSDIADLKQKHKDNLKPDNSNLLNVRMQGELAGDVGDHIGKQIQLKNDAYGSLAQASSSQQIFGQMAHDMAILYNHSMGTMLKQLNNPIVLSYQNLGDPTKDAKEFGFDAPHTTDAIREQILQQRGSMVGTAKPFTVNKSGAYFSNIVDPVSASAFIFRASPGSPKFAFFALPGFSPSQQAYKVEVLENGQWKFLAFVLPWTEFFFPEVGGVSDFRISEIDSLNLDPNEPLLVELGFASNGDFTGSIEAIPAVPEPTTILLWGTTMAGLGLAARWRRRNRKQKP